MRENAKESRSDRWCGRLRYRAAMGEPGANDVLVHEGGLRPKPRALRASSPAAINRRGSDVLVQLVMAAMATLPVAGSPPFARSAGLADMGASAASVIPADFLSCSRCWP